MVRPRDACDSRGSGPLSTTALSAAAISTPAPAPVSEARLDAEEALAFVLARLDDDKAEDIISIDLRGKTSIADHMVVASGRSQRHVGAIAEHLIEALKAQGVRNIRVEGMPACDWVLIDAGDTIVHIFQPEVRGFYNLEKMWAGTRLEPADRFNAPPRG